jgi:hypothetical protein
MKINLHIERLVLDDLPIERTQGSKVRAAVEQELTRLLAVGGLSQQLGTGASVPRLRGGNIKVANGVQAGGLGAKIARAVHEVIGRKR